MIRRMIFLREIGLSFIGEGMKTILSSLPLRLKNDRGWVYNARDFAVMIVSFRGFYHVR